MAKLHVRFVTAFLVFVSSLAAAQSDRTDPVSWVNPNREIRLADLPSLTAPSGDSSVVLTSALETIVHDKTLCCGKGSAFEDAVHSGPQSLKDLSTALQGGHFWSDHPQAVHVGYAPQGAIDPGVILNALLERNAAIIEWKSHFYVVSGAVFDEISHYSGRREYAVHKFLLLDPRFSGDQRQAEFNRDTDDWGTVQSLMTLTVGQH